MSKPTSDFDQLFSEIAAQAVAHEARTRRRDANTERRFRYAVRMILLEAWRALQSIPPRDCSIHLSKQHYKSGSRYGDTMLAYRQVKAAYDVLKELGYVHQTRKGYWDPHMLQGRLTSYQATPKLCSAFAHFNGFAAFAKNDAPEAEVILLRIKDEGRKSLNEYHNTAVTQKHRENLSKINRCLQRHWLDLELENTAYAALAERITNHPDKNPIDFSQRTLVRIFNSITFDSGGRFYRGWWQNLPSEYRKYLTIDTKRTAEFDFSQMNPNMLYCLAGADMGATDAYDRVLDGQHRKLVKQAFNSMVQAKGSLQQCPKTIDLSGTGLTWATLRKAILRSHKPINDYFFKGYGNKLQYEDSCIAEQVMLHFTKSDIPIYPVHDSFIMHHGYGPELEEAMNKAFYERFGRDIHIKHDEVDWTYGKKPQTSGTLDIEAIMNADSHMSLWATRNEAWLTYSKLRQSDV